MIFNCHTHIIGPNDIGGSFLSDAKRGWGDSFELNASIEQHQEEMKYCDGAIVLAFDAEDLGWYTTNEYVAEYVSRDPEHLIGFCSVNPKREDAVQRLVYAHDELGLRGLKLGPIYQCFDPLDKMCYPLYAKAQELKMPILWHMATSFPHAGPLDLSNPVMIDPIARAFPDLKMIIAHLGHPWCAETVCLIRKHPNVYADISALWPRPWQFYNAMVNVMEYGVPHKVIFGTDFPFGKTQETLAAFRNINAIVEGTNLPRIPENVIEEIIHRNTPELLGLV